MNILIGIILIIFTVVVIVKLSRYVAYKMITKPIVYNTLEEFRTDDLVTSKKWRKFRWGAKILDTSHPIPALVIVQGVDSPEQLAEFRKVLQEKINGRNHQDSPTVR